VVGRPLPRSSDPDLHQLPIDVAEGAMAKRTPPEPQALVGISRIDPGFVRPCHGGEVNEASHDVNHRSHCPPGFDSCIPAISERLCDPGRHPARDRGQVRGSRAKRTSLCPSSGREEGIVNEGRTSRGPFHRRSTCAPRAIGQPPLGMLRLLGAVQLDRGRW
jgi:hypothetical protein